MNKNLKTNSRFSALVEDGYSEVSYKKDRKKNMNEKIPSIKDESLLSSKNNNPMFTSRFKDSMSKEKKDKFQKDQKEEDIKKKLAKENFPDLYGNTKINENKITKTNNSYLEKTAKIIVKDVKTDDNVVPQNNVTSGWVEIKWDTKKSRKPVYTYGINNEMSDKAREENPVNLLVNLHNKRRQEYIDMWGYETWEKMFRSPSYDYHYFDKLDEEYERQIEEQLSFDLGNEY